MATFDAITSSHLWTANSPAFGNYLEASTVVDGVVYSGANDSGIDAINAATGQVLDREPLSGAPVNSALAYSNGLLFMMSQDGTVYTYDTVTQQASWSAITGSNFSSASPIIADGVLYVGNQTGVYAFDEQTGVQLWQYNTGSVKRIISADHKLLVSSNTGLHAFTAERELTALDPARIWVGLANNNDKGIRFDLRAEVYKNSTLVSSGQLDSVGGGDIHFEGARHHIIPFNSFLPVEFSAGSNLRLKLYVRNACTGSNKNNGAAKLWFGNNTANSRFKATLSGVENPYYLQEDFVLTSTAGTGPRSSIEQNAGQQCSAFKSFGTWKITP